MKNMFMKDTEDVLMTSMYIDFCLESNERMVDLDKFFAGKIKKQICKGKEIAMHDEYRWQLITDATLRFSYRKTV